MTLASGKSLVIRFTKKYEPDADDSRSSFPISKVGEKRLFFLGQTEDKQTFGLAFGACGRFDLKATEPTCTNGSKTSLEFAKSVKPTDFVNTLKTALLARQKGQ